MADWSTALPDWQERIQTGRPLVPDLPLFKDQAARALRIFKRLRIPDVIGKPTMAEACGPWFFPIVEAMFGSYDPETHRRMIQEFFLLIPKKNSKSSNGGALMVTAVIMNERPEGEFNLIAPTIEIAKIAFKQAEGTIKADPELDKLFQCQEYKRIIQHRVNGTELKIKAADTDVVTGGKPVGTMIDETHVFTKRSNAADVFVEVRGALTARPDGFLFQTTTQSKDSPAGVFNSELSMARKVRDGKLNLPMLPVLYEYPPDMVEADAWKDRRTWHIVNPNLGRSVDQIFLENGMRRAEEGSEEDRILFASQHFNVEIGLRLGSDAWSGAKHWAAAAETGLTLDAILARSDVVTIGIDGGGLDDLLGLCVLGRDAETRQRLAWFHAWCQRSVLEERKQIAPRLQDFEAAGDLTICDEVTQDVTEVADHVEQVSDLGLLPEKDGIGLDPVGVAALVDEMAERGITGDVLAGVPQGYRLHGAIEGMGRKLADGTQRHGGQLMMDWVVGNAKAEQRGNAVLITKQAAGKAKIDPLLAGFNAFALMDRNPTAAGLSVYQTRGLLVA